jgi:succinoglycan biosynthesis transport protein ExoP
MMTNVVRSEQAAVYLRLITRWWWIPVLFGLFSTGLTYAASRALTKPLYTSSTTLEVSSPYAGSSYSSGANDANSDAVLMTTGPVFDQALKHLDAAARRDPSALGSIRCTADTNNVFITCSAASRDPAAAAGALNTLTRTFIEVNQAQQNAQYRPSLTGLQTQEKQVRAEIAGLRQRLTTALSVANPSTVQQYRVTALQSQISQDQGSLSQLTVQESSIRQQILSAGTSIRIVNPAAPSSVAINLHPARNAFLGLIIGLGIAAALIVLLEYLDDTFRSSEDVTAILGTNVVGAVRRFENELEGGPIVAAKSPRSAIAEAYRVSRTNIDFASLEHPLHILLITSSRDGEGKTTTSSNLAATYALSGKRVLLVDVDLRRAGLTRRFGLKAQSGLSTDLMESPTGISAHDTEIPKLKIVPSGPFPPNPAELLGSPQMKEWLDHAQSEYDLVILDAPPILSLSDTRMLGPMADAVLLIVDPSLSTRRLVRQARLALDAVGARVLGVIVNKGTFHSDQHYYYNYYTYYDTYSRLEQNGRVSDMLDQESGASGDKVGSLKSKAR